MRPFMQKIPRLLVIGILLLSLNSGISLADETGDEIAPFSLNSPGIPLVPGHSGEDYVFTGNYASGQVTITGSGAYHLTDNLNASHQDYGIGILAPDVILFGNGKTLTSSQNTDMGVSIAEGGTDAWVSAFIDISGFRDGIHVNGDSAVISNNSVSHNTFGIFYLWGNYGFTIGNTVYLNENSGIYSYHSGGDYAVIQENKAFENRRIGIYSGGNYARILDNKAYNNGLYGIMTGGGDVGGTDPGPEGRGYYANVTGNFVGQNAMYGIYSALPSARVLNNMANYEQVGIMIRPRLNCSAVGNLIIGSTVGFRTSYSPSLNLTFTGNYLFGNEQYGIHIRGDIPEGNGQVFNNFFANNENVKANGSFANILWTNPAGPTPGLNVVEGPNIAGNYWGSALWNGWSDLQEPSKSGYSSVPYEVVPGSGVYDTAPLVWPGEEVSSSSDGWTTVQPYGDVTYPRDSDARYITQAKPGAVLEKLKVDGVLTEPEPDNSYTFYELVDDHSIETIGSPAPGQVHVMFTITPASGSYPLPVQFNDTSIGGPSSWYWQLGDGATSNLQNLTHTYTIPGRYTISLRAFNNQTGGFGVCNDCIQVTE